MNKIKAVVFDWAGTTVDYGCFAPVRAFLEVFREAGIQPAMEEVRGPMGVLKRDHIRMMLEMDRIHHRLYGRNDGDCCAESCGPGLPPGLLVQPGFRRRYGAALSLYGV